MTSTIHAFEEAGLGAAPFKVTGYFQSKYCPAPGAPIQPGSTCDFCGTAIMNVFLVLSADGKESKIGCDCVKKTGDEGLKKQISQIQREQRWLKEELRLEAERKEIEAAKTVLPKVAELLAAEPHPVLEGKTKLDYVVWLFENAYHSGQLRAAGMVGQALKGQAQ